MNLGPRKSFLCPICGQVRIGVRARCYECHKPLVSAEGRERIRQALLGRKQSDEHRRKISEWQKGNVNRPNLAELMRGKHGGRWKPIGSERVSNGHTQVKVSEGRRWKYRARMVWEQAFGVLLRTQLIHHVNGDPFDDRLENLQMVTRAEHAKLHADSDTMRSRGALAQPHGGERNADTMRERGRRGLIARGYNVS